MIQTSSQWFTATVKDIRPETPTVKTFVFELPHVAYHLAGQHYEIRLTAPDGYQAARLYSAASAADGSNILELTIAILQEGEVTPYLFNNVFVGNKLELRGPLGKFFVWMPDEMLPLLLVGGGTGIAPMRAIRQAHVLAGSQTKIRLVYGARNKSEIIYKPEFLDASGLRPTSSEVVISLSDAQPGEWQGKAGLINYEMLHEILEAFDTLPLCYVCGTTPFVETMANTLLKLGVPAEHIRAERFGAAAT